MIFVHTTSIDLKLLWLVYVRKTSYKSLVRSTCVNAYVSRTNSMCRSLVLVSMRTTATSYIRM